MAKNVLLAFLSTLLALGLAEILLRLVNIEPEQYAVYPPGYHLTLRPDPTLLVGVRSGVKHFTISRDGLRGRPLDSRSDEYRILAIGGSTTESIYHDDADAWTALLERGLGSVGARHVWVGGAGRSGLNTRDHIVQLRYLSDELPPLDAVIVLAGANDLNVALSQGDHFVKPMPLSDPEEEYRTVRRAFATVPRSRRLAGPPPARWYQRFVLYDAARRARNLLTEPRRRARMDLRGNSVARWRAARRAARFRRDTLPYLIEAIEEYRDNLETLVAVARSHRQRLVLMTQPTLWRGDLSHAEEQRLWLGGVGKFTDVQVDIYYTAGALRKAMDRFNATMRDMCRTEHVECVDLAAELPSDTSVFYDDLHFGEDGARRIAQVLIRNMRAGATP